MRPVVVGFDVVEAGASLEGVVIPVKLLVPPSQGVSVLLDRYEKYCDSLIDGRISSSDGAEVALEVANVDGVEADLY